MVNQHELSYQDVSIERNDLEDIVEQKRIQVAESGQNKIKMHNRSASQVNLQGSLGSISEISEQEEEK